MDTTKINEIEEAIIKYYEDKKFLELLKIRLKILNSNIKELKEKINSGKIEFNIDIKAQNYDSIGSSSNESHGIEVEIEKAYLRLENLLERKKIEVIEIENKIFDIKTKVDCITEILTCQVGLNSKLNEMLDLRYNRKYSMKDIANKFYAGAIATAYRDRDRVLELVEAIVRLYGKDILEI
ncbi:hypothetical protein [Clostridium tarantellae]|uniref:Uncharacterized protein n=1 Tax=Clostridium tarantellae TaxID=39493 RepID=A0A6I1ML67_9CLOT|nr:hypothetical protein [Clostridium tarantellae]MPQ42857.1 hypothetical protein [Clostridium tarantellae]